MQPAQNHLCSRGAIAIRQLVGLVDLRAETRNRDGVEVAGQPRRVMHVGHIDVFELDIVRSRAGEGEQTETRKRSDNAIAFYESRQRQAERGQLRVVRANSTHCQKSDLHVTNQPPISPPSPTSPATTRLGKRYPNPARHAFMTQHSGIVTIETAESAAA